MTDDITDEFSPQDPADRLRAPSNSPFSLPGDEEPQAAGLEVVLVQAEIDAHIFDLKTLEKTSQKKSIQKLVDLGPPAVEPLCAYLKHPDRWARMMAAEVLGKIHDPRAIPALKAALNDQHQGVRYMAELALKEISASTAPEGGTPVKGKEGQGKPPQPAKVTAKLHPVDGRNKPTAQKPPEAAPPAAESKPKPEQKPPPVPTSNLPEPKIPENLPEIKPLEARVVEQPAPKPPIPAVAAAAFPPPPMPPQVPPSPPVSDKPSPSPLDFPTAALSEAQLPEDIFPFDAPDIAMVGIQSDTDAVEIAGLPARGPEENALCPVCQLQIKADTRVCPHCHAKFDVSLKGFCPNCRKSVEIDPFDHHCPRCGEEVIDQRYESKLVAFGDIKPGAAIPSLSEPVAQEQPDAFLPSAAGVEEPASQELVPAAAPLPEGEFPPIEVAALQEFADRYLGTEGETPPPTQGFPPQPKPEDFYTSSSSFDPGMDAGLTEAEYIHPTSPEYPPPPAIPPLVSAAPPVESPLPPPAVPPSESGSLRPMFAAAAAGAAAGHDDYGYDPVVPNVRRFAQEGGTPIYVPGQDDGVTAFSTLPPDNPPEEQIPPAAAKKKAEPVKPKPVRKKPESAKPAEEGQPPKKTEAVFTAEDYYLYGNSLVPPEKSPPGGKGDRREEPEGRGINPWLIAAPLFLVAAGLMYLLYFKATGREAPYIPAILATTVPTPAATFTPEPTPKPTVIVPGWVGEFVTPILDEVSPKKPDFFDNFSIPDAQWGFRDGNKPALGSVTLENEALLMSVLKDYGMARQRKVNFNHFAETLDIVFGQNDQSKFEEVFAGSYGSWALHMTNTGENWEGTIMIQDPKTEEWTAVQSGSVPAQDPLKASLTIIRNGDRIAILVDGEPFMYYEDPALPKTMFHDYYFLRGASTGQVQMILDNIRIWNLDKYPDLPS